MQKVKKQHIWHANEVKSFFLVETVVSSYAYTYFFTNNHALYILFKLALLKQENAACNNRMKTQHTYTTWASPI